MPEQIRRLVRVRCEVTKVGPRHRRFVVRTISQRTYKVTTIDPPDGHRRLVERDKDVSLDAIFDQRSWEEQALHGDPSSDPPALAEARAELVAALCLPRVNLVAVLYNRMAVLNGPSSTAGSAAESKG